MSDLISRQAAIDALDLPIYNIKGKENAERVIEYLKAVIQRIKDLPSAQPEQLTDKEHRIFLAAMAREEEVCRKTDDECRDCREPYEDSLVRTCHEITRKVRGALWTI